MPLENANNIASCDICTCVSRQADVLLPSCKIMDVGMNSQGRKLNLLLRLSVTLQVPRSYACWKRCSGRFHGTRIFFSELFWTRFVLCELLSYSPLWSLGLWVS